MKSMQLNKLKLVISGILTFFTQERVQRNCILFLAAYGFGGMINLYWPGGASPDSLYQLTQARTGEYTDHHPPLVSLIWRYIDMIYPGQGGMLVLQVALLWVGLYFVARNLKFNIVESFLYFLLVGYFPLTLGLFGVIWKDVFVVSGSIVVASILFTQKKISIYALVVAFIFSMLVVGSRHNGICGVGPLWGFYFFNIFKKTQCFRRWFLSMVLGMIAACGIFIFTSIAVELAVHPQKSNAWTFTLAYDLIGIYHVEGRVDHPLPIPFLHKALNIDQINRFYDTRSSVNMFAPKCIQNTNQCEDPIGSPAYGQPEVPGAPDHRLSQLISIWAHEIITHPRAYLQHRWNIMSELIGYTNSPLWAPAYLAVDANNLGVTFDTQDRHHDLTNWVYQNQYEWWFRIWPYIILCVVLIFGSFYYLDDFAIRCAHFLGWSGFFYEAAYFIISPSSDFRYSMWFLTATASSSVIILLKVLRVLTTKVVSRSFGSAQ